MIEWLACDGIYLIGCVSDMNCTVIACRVEWVQCVEFTYYHSRISPFNPVPRRLLDLQLLIYRKFLYSPTFTTRGAYESITGQ